ncbi:MAG: c-type cytochrome [Anaerolineae bacterium]
MTRQVMLVGLISALAIVISACGTQALPSYDADSTSVAVARTATRDALLTQGAIIPTDTPTITPSPTVDFEATAAAEQAIQDANATATAEFEATVAAEQAQATANAQATIDAMPTEIGADDPLFEAIANADAANGEALFAANALVPCSTCHHVIENPETQLAGPNQWQLFSHTVERIAEGTIDAPGPYTYIYESIINPNDYIVEGYVAGVMIQGYGDALSEQELYDLVAYLVTLGE